MQKTEIHLNEWNYLPGDWSPTFSRNGNALQKWFDEAGGVRGAAFVACVLLGLQDAPLDMGNFYTGDNGAWGLFNRLGVPKKTYYAFRGFKTLVDHPLRVAVEGGTPGQLAAAAGLAADGHEIAIVLSNYKSADKRIHLLIENLPWTGRSECESLILDENRNLAPLPKQSYDGPKIGIAQELPAPALLLVYVRKARP